MSAKALIPAAILAFIVAATAVAAFAGSASAANTPPTEKQLCGDAPKFSTYEAMWHELDEDEWMAQYDATGKAWDDCVERNADVLYPPTLKAKPRHSSAKQLRHRRAARKAEKAVIREVNFDHGARSISTDPDDEDISCNQRGRNYYTCDFELRELTPTSSNRFHSDTYRGRARVHQYGKRHAVDYRISW